MNLIIIAALIAVCGAAKLDRTYLPPASAKTAGGSSGELQTPFSTKTFNNGLGGLPKGSYTNEFQGVVVDAAAAGTRAAAGEDTGLGAPRISYGSTDSKVGGAAFKVGTGGFGQSSDGAQTSFNGSPNFDDGQTAGTQVSQGFQRPQGQTPPSQGQFGQSFERPGQERPRAALDRAAQTVRFENNVDGDNFNFAFETDNGIAAEESGVATQGVQAQGGFSYTGDDGQVYSVTYTADEGGYQPKGDHLPTPPPIPEAILKSLEKNARDEAAGLVDDGSYNAQKYNVGSDYTDSDGSNGKFSHQSSKFGRPQADATASGTFISQSNQPFGRPGQNAQETSGFGAAGQAGQNGQAAQNGQSDQFDSSGSTGPFGVSQTAGQTSGFSNGPSSLAGQFGQGFGNGGSFGQDTSDDDSAPGATGPFDKNAPGTQGQRTQSTSSGQGFKNQNAFGANSAVGFAQNTLSGQGNGFGNKNEYLPPFNTLNQNGRPQSARPQSGTSQSSRPQNPESENEGALQFGQSNQDSSTDFVPLGQQSLQGQNRPTSSPSFGRPSSNGFGQASFGRPSDASTSASNTAFRPSANTVDSFGSQSSQNYGNGLNNEYLPPVGNFNQNPRPSKPQRLTGTSQYNKQYSNSQTSGSFSSSQQPGQGRPQGTFSGNAVATGSQASFGPQSGFQKPQAPSRPLGFQNGNERFPGSQGSQTPFGSNASKRPLNVQSPTQSTTSFTQPDTELTTPIESDKSQNENDALPSQSTFTGFTSSSQSSTRRPVQSSFGNQFNNGQFASAAPTSASDFPPFSPQTGSRPQASRPFGAQTQSAGKIPSFSGQFPTQSQFQTQSPAKEDTFDGSFSSSSQGSQFNNNQPQGEDVQYSSSTQRPTTFSQQQAQGPDDSYYYKQPAKPFGTPSGQGSRFPSSPSSQFNRVTQQQSFSQNNQFSSPSQQNVPSSALPAQNEQFLGSTRYPQPPTIAAPAPTSPTQSQYQGTTFSSQYNNGITQASISSFPSQAPTQPTTFGRPNYQSSNQFNQAQSEPIKPTFGQQSQQATTSSFPQRPGKPTFSAQNQFGQNQPESDDASQTVKNPQYNGEIYEYNKPAQTLPPPDSTPSTTKFGQKEQSFIQSMPQFGQSSDDSQSSTTSQFGVQAGSRPQLGAGASRPGQIQNGFNSQSSQQSQDNRPFGALASRPESQPQTELHPDSDEYQTETSMPQFGFGSQNGQSNRPGKPCCGALSVPPSIFKPTPSPQKAAPGFPQSLLGSGFSGTQTSNFAGKGEVFGGPRKPPSFDSQTGYHY